jgi:hypothetical protein
VVEQAGLLSPWGVVSERGRGREPGGRRSARFALAKFRPTTLPTTLVDRPALHDRLTAGTGQLGSASRREAVERAVDLQLL